MKTASVLATLATALCIGAIAPARADVVTTWNAITLNCVQGGTTQANRAGPAGLLDIALVQAAVHDAVQAVEGRYRPYHYRAPDRRGRGSTSAAAEAAAYHTLAGLYGTGAACLAGLSLPADRYPGDAALATGRAAAEAVLPLYRPAIALPTDPWRGSDAPGQWRPTSPGMIGASTFLAVTAPFAMNRPDQFQPARPPRLTSLVYRWDYDEVKRVGAATGSTRTAEQTDLARFWTDNYFTQWNRALRGIAERHLDNVGDRARLLALASFVAADSQISVYEAKYRYNFWRPVTAIRHGDADGNPWTVGDPEWVPLISSPPYPEYSSGANCITGGITTLLELFFGTDEKPFEVSSNVSGVTVPVRRYERFSDAAREVVEARILAGIHFRFADDIGRRQGARIAHWTYRHYLQPIRQR